MMNVSVLDTVKAFLEEKVASKIQLQRSEPEESGEYALMHPNVFVGWVPPEGYLPVGITAAIPCIVVGMDTGEDDRVEKETLAIRLSLAVYDPGLHDPENPGPFGYTPSLEGYRNLVNFTDHTRAELLKHHRIGNLSLEGPVKWGIYKDQPWPYWYSYITLTLRQPSYPAVQARKLVD